MGQTSSWRLAPNRIETSCPSHRETQILTCVTKFHLLDLSEDPDLQPILFGLFPFLYLVSMLGNLLIILAITSDPNLHTPIYFFLSIISLADIGFTSTTILKMLVNIQTHHRAISCTGCLRQLSFFFFFAIFACMGDMLLTIMAYDRYVAICLPLKYTVIMNPHVCAFLVSVSFVVSLQDSQLHLFIFFKFPSFKDFDIASFFHNPAQLLSLCCSDTLTHDVVMYFTSTVFAFFPILGIIWSYYEIVSSILQMSIPAGWHKAFSTCGSHLSVVCLFYGTGMGVYLFSDVASFPRESTVASVMCTVVTPLRNPFIYSLRNKDIQSTLWSLYRRKTFPSSSI
ncbi:LOW QUALITY PROTEIN: olfactory receptor 18-like [Dipodomys spectabilis]|uniref:LOW QUALITY PROTEIN: olfactory receptor 18-like n=1 Tax=Dipodomys spectabilis TaxID=105255 RepID=UPI001C546CA8|nr:LOW QUALITY PROTEIN: olfactory receptor 18-like [Dipodomys spectabilis]